MIMEYSVSIKIDKEVHLASLLKSLGSDYGDIRVSVLRDGYSKVIKSCYFSDAQLAAVELTEAELQSQLSKEQKLARALYDAHDLAADKAEYNAILYTEKIVSDAMDEGMRLAKEFAAENVRLGITADGMTRTVRQKLADLFNALQTGSLLDAIEVAKETPAEDKDVKYITDARLLALVNKLEEYLGLSLSEEL